MSLELIYWDGKGRAECIRLLCAAGGVAFKDTRMADEDTPAAVGNTELKWDEAKKAAPFGQAPYLRVGDKILPQSRAIERYVAKLGHLLGDNEFDAAWIDAIQEQVRDVFQAFRNEGTDDDKKKAFVAGLASNSAVAALAKLAAPGGFLVGNKLSYADVALFQFLNDTLQPVDPAAFDAALPAALKAHKAHVAAVPAIAKYLAARPARPW